MLPQYNKMGPSMYKLALGWGYLSSGTPSAGTENNKDFAHNSWQITFPLIIPMIINDVWLALRNDAY
jgi:hypothetical protein